jgi:hypothetical protein
MSWPREIQFMWIRQSLDIPNYDYLMVQFSADNHRFSPRAKTPNRILSDYHVISTSEFCAKEIIRLSLYPTKSDDFFDKIWHSDLSPWSCGQSLLSQDFAHLLDLGELCLPWRWRIIFVKHDLKGVLKYKRVEIWTLTDRDRGLSNAPSPSPSRWRKIFKNER